MNIITHVTYELISWHKITKHKTRKSNIHVWL